MNKHLKLAILVMPFLLVGGYILADYYLEQAKKGQTFALYPSGHCDVIHQDCLLKAGEFSVSIGDNEGLTEINATYPLDEAILFLVDEDNQAKPYILARKNNAYYWQQHTPLSQLASPKGSRYKLRLIMSVQNNQYISEFYTETR